MSKHRSSGERKDGPSTSSGRTDEGVRYRAASTETLVTTDLPPFAALYHRQSGTTHLLAEPAAEILAALTEPLTLAALRERLAQDFDLSDEAALKARLDELVATGLVATA